MALPVALGTVNFGTAVPVERCYQVLDMFQSLGGNCIDTADNYAFWHPQGQGGESETVIGDWLRQHRRADFRIMTKIGAQALAGKSFDRLTGLSDAAIRRAVAASLGRLRTDYVDVLFAHLDDPFTPLEETWTALSELVESGQVRKLGISNYALARVQELEALIARHGLAPIACVQYRHTVIASRPEADFSPQIALNEALIAQFRAMPSQPIIMAYSPLLDGALSRPGAPLPAQYDDASNRQAAQALQRQASQQGLSANALILANLCAQGIHPVTTSSDPLRLRDNLMLVARQGGDV